MTRFAKVIDRLAATIESRRGGDTSKSYTAQLLGDMDRAAKKMGEEAVETVIAAAQGDRDALTACTHTDGCGHGVAGEMTLFLRLTTPESVLAVLASEALTIGVHRAGATEQTGLRLAAHTGLRALGLGREEQVGPTLADRMVHPVGRGGQFHDQCFEC